MEWQPIETAPTDGTEILAFCPDISYWQRVLYGEVVIAAWKPDQENIKSPIGGGWFSDSCSEIERDESTGDYIGHEPVSPTHWMPLPEPPKETE